MTAINPLNIFRPIHINNLKRLGNDFDGGYIIHLPSLKDADCLVNYGVGYNVEFEKDFFRETGKPTLAFDPTLKDLEPILAKLKNKEFVPFLRHLKNFLFWRFKERLLKGYKINFIEEGIAVKDTLKYKSLHYHLNKYNLINKRIILKIDVEGAEYDIFNDPGVYPLLANAIQILLEIHLISVNHNLERLLTIMNKLKNTHSLIHIHSNNHSSTFKHAGKDVPDAIEVTFLNNSYLPEKNYSTASYPIAGLDQPCDRLKDDIILDFFI